MQLARFFQKLKAFELDCVETTQCLAISIDFEHLQNRVKFVMLHPSISETKTKCFYSVKQIEKIPH